MNKDHESWARVSVDAVCSGSPAQVRNVLAMALADIAEMQHRMAELDQVIAEAICFPSAGLPDHEIRWLHGRILGARDRHERRKAK